MHYWRLLVPFLARNVALARQSFWPLARFQTSEGRMATNVHDILFGNTIVERLGIATIVAIEGRPDHVPLLLCILSALKSASNRAIIHLTHEGLELFAVNNAVSVAVYLVPGIVDLLLESFSISRAAFFFVWDSQRCLERLLGLLLGICEGFLPFPDVVLKRREELLLTLELLRAEKIGAVPGFALLSLLLLLLTGLSSGGLLYLLLVGGGGLLLGGGLCLCGFCFSHCVFVGGVFYDNQINL